MKGDEGSADQRQVTEQYIFKAINYTDAETKLHSYAEMNGIRNFSHKIIAVNINEMIDHHNGEAFWLSKTSYVVTTDSGKDKTVKETQLVNAKNIEDAMIKVREYFKNVASLVPTRIIILQESSILEVIE
jgi:hypothetical protein